MKALFRVTVCLFLVTGILPLCGQQFARIDREASGFPDNSESRKSLEQYIFAPADEARSAPPRVLVQRVDGNRVSFRVEEQGDAFYLLFLNEKDLTFPVASKGNYIIKRSSTDGSFVQIKVFFKDDPGCFVRIYQMGNRSKMDIHLFEQPVYRSITIPLTFSEILTEPFAELMECTKGFVDWNLLMPAHTDFPGLLTRSMADAVRSGLPGLKDAEDGAMDSDGRYVSIATLLPLEHGGLNCSGFAKWIVDGIYYAKTGSYLDISE
ncbi:MAG TPA: hypothetical protein PLG43_14520, partial [Spirochaetia bacterium]|nr:hypothetical protein [Spirochaetia bacterium]